MPLYFLSSGGSLSAGSVETVHLKTGSIYPTNLANNPDALPSSPNASDDEFNTDLSGWTWNNQGTATGSLSNSILLLRDNSNSTDQIRSLYKSPGSTPWEYTAKISGNGVFGNYILYGFWVGETGTTKCYCFQLGYSNGYIINVDKYNSNTSFLGSLFTKSFPDAQGYLRVSDDGTTISFKYSRDGIHYHTATSEARTTHLNTNGPTKVGFYINMIGAAGYLTCDWFRKTG